MKVMPKGQICHKCQKLTLFKDLATWKDEERNIVNYVSPWTCLKCRKEPIILLDEYDD